MAGRVLPMTATQVETILRRYGFDRVSQKGSHRKWRHPDKNLQAIVPFHAGRPLPVGTLARIMHVRPGGMGLRARPARLMSDPG